MFSALTQYFYTEDLCGFELFYCGKSFFLKIKRKVYSSFPRSRYAAGGPK
jgi:hypothetical protein